MAATVTMVTANAEEAFDLQMMINLHTMRKTVLKLVEASDRNVHEALLFIQSEWLQDLKRRKRLTVALICCYMLIEIL